MDFIEKDQLVLMQAYDDFLEYLKEFFKTNQCYSVDQIFQLFCDLFHDGKFGITSSPEKDSNYPFLSLPLHCNDGMQVMLGVCCCRHINGLFFDLLQKVEKDCELSFFYIDEQEQWHKKKNGCGANHIAVTAHEHSMDFLLDVYNNYGFTVTENGELHQLRSMKFSEELIHGYNDTPNVTTISKVLTKYYHLRNLGVTHLYEEAHYGE